MGGITMASPGPGLMPSNNDASAKLLPMGSRLKVTPTLTMSDVRFLAVDPDGTAYATKDSRGGSQLWASTDNARTWKQRGQELPDANFRMMTSLHDGTLLTDAMLRDGAHVLERSADHGVTWSKVLPLGSMLMLTPHSVDELDDSVFLAEYQAYTLDSVPVHIWGSTDRGQTWQVRATFTDRRHAHGLRVDQATHSIWVFFGDNDERTGMVRSTDGWTFDRVITGHAGSAVDAVFTDMGMLFGQDIVYGSTPSSISLLGEDLVPHALVHLPGPSYSIHSTPVGGLLLCTTREPGGDVYAPGDDSAHLLASADGVTWEDVQQFPRVSETAYGRSNIYWGLNSGELVVQISDVLPTGPGYGIELVKVEVAK
jgi:hypothetical protein